MILPKGSIIGVATTAVPGTINQLSEHQRGDLSVDTERIEKTHRTANGMLRKWFVADKRTWSVSWDMLPHSAQFTVDGKWGGQEIEAFYLAQTGSFWLSIKTPGSIAWDTQVLVVFKSFSKSVQKRGRYDFWNVSIALEEV
jgi:hypothetical protein